MDTCTCPEHGRWYSAADIDPLVRRIDVALHGEDGAARQALLIDVVPHITHAANMHGPLLAALSAQPSPGGQGDASEREGWRKMQKAAASQTRKDGVGACDALYELAVKHGANDADAAGFAHHVNGSLALLETQTHDGLHREATMEAALAARQPVAGLSWADYWMERGQPDVAHDFDAFSRAEAWALQRFPAAVQPVGVPAMYQVRPRSFPAGEGWREVSKRQFDDRGEFPGYPEAEWERRTLYAAPPAQAVDLGQLPPRWVVEFWHRFGHRDEANKLLALIDSQAVKP